MPVLEPIAVVGAAGEKASFRGISPRAKAVAREEGLPLGAIASGSGPGGRIIERDVRDTLASGPGMTSADLKAAKHTPLGTADLAFPGPYVDTPIKSTRKIIADRMMHSLHSSAQLTLNSSAPAGRLLALRGRPCPRPISQAQFPRR